MRILNYIVIIFWTIAGLALADNFYVSTRGSDSTGDGSMLNPWRTIQHAVDSITGAPANPHNICVAKGLYEEGVWMYENDWESLLGGYDDSTTTWTRDISSNLTILRNVDADKFVILSGNNSVFEGFKVEDAVGYGANFRNMTVKNNVFYLEDRRVGFSSNCSPVIEKNFFNCGVNFDNQARHIFKNNVIIANNPIGLSSIGASPQVIGNYIANAGTGISSGVPVIKDNIIEYCSTGISSGGPCIEGNILRNNMYGVYDYLAGGGRFRNNLIVNNLGGGINLGPGSSVTLQGCILAGNGMGLRVGTATVRDSIFWGNEIDTYWPDYDIRYSFTNQAGEGNVWDETGPGFVGWGDFSTTNPIWVDANRGQTGGSGTVDDPFSSITLALRSYDYHLTSSSLCRGAGQGGKDIGFYPTAASYPEVGKDWGVKIIVRPGLYREQCLTTSYGVDISGQERQSCIIAGEQPSGTALGLFFGRTDSWITSLTLQGIGRGAGIRGHVGLAEVEGCRFENLWNGVRFEPFPIWWARGYFHILHNEFTHCYRGIELWFGDYDGALIKGNWITGSEAAAMLISAPAIGWTDITENELTGNTGGIWLSGWNTECYNNSISGTRERPPPYTPEQHACVYISTENRTGRNIFIYNNLIVNNHTWGIYQQWGRDVEIHNNTIYGNDRVGIDAEPGETPEITNCIIWGNTGGSLGQYLSATYSCIEGGAPGEGNISLNAEFANPAAGDFHLKSKGGRWDPSANGGSGGWVIDTVHSACIDAGDPTSDYSNEPEPNGGRINMGAYGNTPYASKWAETPTPTPSPTLTPTPTITPTVTPTPSPTITPVPTLTPTPTPTGTPEISELEVNDGQLLSVAGDYEFLFSDVSELLLSGTFTQDSRGKITFTGTIVEDSTTSPIDTKGKLRLKKNTGEVAGKLKRRKLSGARVKLKLFVSNDDLGLTMKYKKKGEPKIIANSGQPLVCPVRGARIIIEDMIEEKPERLYSGSGTLYLPCGLEVPVSIKEKIKTKKDGSLIRRYKIKASDRSARLKLKTYMPSAEAQTIELLRARGRISYLKKLNPTSINLTY